MELKGTTAIITGSSGRLGFWIAKALGQAGCNCVCHFHRNKERADQLVDQIAQFGSKAVSVQADLTDPEQINVLFNKAREFDTPRVLVNSAAVFLGQSLQEVTFKVAQDLLNLNLLAPVLISRMFAGQINTEFADSATVTGKIINISDVGGIRPWAGHVLYCSSKAGLIGATKALAKELAPCICVNSVAVGMVTWHSDDNSEKKRQLSFIPVGRIAEPSEITEAIIFLLENDYITGQVLNVDGGRGI